MSVDAGLGEIGMNERGGGGGRGRADSGSHGEEDKASLNVFEAFWRCVST